MLTASIETQQIFNGIVQFISYMVLAVFAENVILARALGVTFRSLRYRLERLGIKE